MSVRERSVDFALKHHFASKKEDLSVWVNFYSSFWKGGYETGIITDLKSAILGTFLGEAFSYFNEFMKMRYQTIPTGDEIEHLLKEFIKFVPDVNYYLNKSKNGKTPDYKKKPCYILNYCPYGELVEYFPLDGKHVTWEGIFLPSGTPIDGAVKCNFFGHDCPAQYVAEPVTEKSDKTFFRHTR